MFTPPNMSRVTCHVSRVTCHVSRVTCHVSRVTCHMSFFFFFFFFLTKWSSLSVEGLLSTGPTPSSLFQLRNDLLERPLYQKKFLFWIDMHRFCIRSWAKTICDDSSGPVSAASFRDRIWSSPRGRRLLLEWSRVRGPPNCYVCCVLSMRLFFKD